MSPFLKRTLREPLLHFLVLGALIFAVAHWRDSARAAAAARIVVDERIVARIARLAQAQSGIAPAESQLGRLVENFVDDEVLFREAQRLGLDRDDEIIRRRLIQKLEFLQRDAVSGIDFDDATLRAWYVANPDKFLEPETLSFTHVYFSADAAGDARAFERARAARARLAAGGSAAGDAPPVPTNIAAVTREDARRLFGSSPFVDVVFAARPGEWSQPVRSGFGWHLLRVTNHTAARLRDFASARAEVRAEYLRVLSDEARRRQLDALRARYDVAYAPLRANGAT